MKSSTLAALLVGLVACSVVVTDARMLRADAPAPTTAVEALTADMDTFGAFLSAAATCELDLASAGTIIAPTRNAWYMYFDTIDFASLYPKFNSTGASLMDYMSQILTIETTTNGTVIKSAGCPAAFKALLSYHLSATAVGSLTSANGTKIAVSSISTTLSHVALVGKKNVTVADTISVKFNLDKTAPVFVDLLGRSVAVNSFAEPSTFANGTQVLYCVDMVLMPVTAATLKDLFLALPGHFGYFYAAMMQLEETQAILNDASTPYTVFAPYDDAIERYAAAHSIAPWDLYPASDAAKTLAFISAHLVSNKSYTAAGLLAAGEKDKAVTLDDSSISFLAGLAYESGSPYVFLSGVGGGPIDDGRWVTLIDTDLSAGKSLVQSVGALLLPNGDMWGSYYEY